MRENLQKILRLCLTSHFEENGTVFRLWDVGVWTGSSWLRIGTGGRPLVFVVSTQIITWHHGDIIYERGEKGKRE